MRKHLFTVILAAILLLSTFICDEINVVNAVDLTDSSGIWTPVIAGNEQNDYIDDQQTGSHPVSQDIVGDDIHTLQYTDSLQMAM